MQTLEHEAEAEVIEVVPCKAEPTVRTTVFAGLPKGERSDFLVQKCTEAGAAGIVFFSCTRCVAKAANIEKKVERWQRIAEEAAKQSGRTVIAAAGGVAANSVIRADLERACKKAGCRLYLPPLRWCGDNGAMIGAQGYYEYLAGHTAGMDLNAYATRDISE